MKISIDEKVCKKHKKSFLEATAYLFIKACFLEDKNAEEYLNYLKEKKDIFVNTPKTLFHGPIYYLGNGNQDILNKIILDSDNSLPVDSELDVMAKQLQSKFPSGKMQGSNYYYRGNCDGIAHHLKKWWKIYNADGKYTFEDILKATERYVSQYSDDRTGMRMCQYFILKDDRRENRDGKVYVEQVSDLATMLENADSDDINEDYNLVV